jgi:hypothetical protein
MVDPVTGQKVKMEEGEEDRVKQEQMEVDQDKEEDKENKKRKVIRNIFQRCSFYGIIKGKIY